MHVDILSTIKLLCVKSPYKHSYITSVANDSLPLPFALIILIRETPSLSGIKI